MLSIEILLKNLETVHSELIDPEVDPDDKLESEINGDYNNLKTFILGYLTVFNKRKRFSEDFYILSESERKIKFDNIKILLFDRIEQIEYKYVSKLLDIEHLYKTSTLPGLHPCIYDIIEYCLKKPCELVGCSEFLVEFINIQKDSFNKLMTN